MHIFNMTLYLSRIIPRLIKVTACVCPTLTGRSACSTLTGRSACSTLTGRSACPTLTGRWAHVDKDTDKHSSLLLSSTDFNLKIKIST